MKKWGYTPPRFPEYNEPVWPGIDFSGSEGTISQNLHPEIRCGSATQLHG
jgi:hypothetical protein